MYDKLGGGIVFGAEGFCWPKASLENQYPEVQHGNRLALSLFLSFFLFLSLSFSLSRSHYLFLSLTLSFSLTLFISLYLYLSDISFL